MKNRLAPILFLSGIIFCIISLKDAQIITSEVLNVFLFFIVPSLAPTMLLDCLFLYTGGLNVLSNNGKRSLSIPIIILGIMSGTPTLLTYVDEALSSNNISKDEAQHIVESFLMPSFPFLFAISLRLQNSVMKWAIISVILLVNIVFYIMKKPKKSLGITKTLPTNYQGNMLEKTFLTTCKNLALIMGSMLLFSLPILLLQLFLSNVLLYGCIGIFEFSFSLTKLTNYSTFLSYSFIAFIASFGSFSLFAQVKTLCPKIDIKRVIKKRFIIALCSFFIILGILSIIYLI